MRKIFSVLMMLAALVSCKPKESKTLVLYYSQTGATKTVAEEIARLTGADIATFDVVERYDGTYEQTIQRCIGERESGTLSALAPLDVDLAEYDTIFLGYPVWFGTCARPVLSLLREVKTARKNIITFCTFGSGGLQSSTADIAKAAPRANVTEGFGIRNARIGKAPKEVHDFLVRSGFIEGYADQLGEFSQMYAITRDTAQIFHEACDSYPMPLGTPVNVAVRRLRRGYEYIFLAETVDGEGKKSTSQVYVTLESGAAPEFTQVVR